MSDNHDLQMSNCKHQQLTTFGQLFYCLQCGAYQPKDGFSTLKQRSSGFPALCDPVKFLNTQISRGFTHRIENAAYLCQRRSLLNNMQIWADKLSLTMNTLFVGMQYLDQFYCESDENHYQLYAAASLMLAAKTVELDERIPFISKMKRVTFLPYSVQDIRKAECTLLKKIGWDLQKTTIMDWVDTVFSIGAVFDNDEIDRSVLAERINNFQIVKPTSDKPQATTTQPLQTLKSQPQTRLIELFERIEKFTKQVCLQVLMEPALIPTDPMLLVMSIVAYIRKLSGIKEQLPTQFQEIWPHQQTCLDLTDLLPQLTFQVPVKRTFTGLQDYQSFQYRQANHHLTAGLFH